MKEIKDSRVKETMDEVIEENRKDFLRIYKALLRRELEESLIKGN